MGDYIFYKGRWRGNSITDTIPSAVGKYLKRRVDTNTGIEYYSNGNDWIRSGAGNETEQNCAYSYKIYKESLSGNYRLVDLKNATALSINSDAAVVFNSASTNTHAKGLLNIMPATYTFLSKWDCRNKSILIKGERAASSGMGGQLGDVILKAGFDDVSGPFIDCHSTAYNKMQFKDIVIDCDGRTKTGIDCYDVRERLPFLEGVKIYQAIEDGLILEKCHYTTIRDLDIADCGTGLLLKGTTANEKCNTLYITDSLIHINGCNIKTEGSVVDVVIDNCMLEQNNDVKPFTNSIYIADSQTYDLKVMNCSFEYSGALSKVLIEDNGNNNLFENNRFDSYHTSFVAYHAKANCKNSIFRDNFIQANNANTTCYVDVDATAQNIQILYPRLATNTPLKFYVRDANPLSTRKIGANIINGSAYILGPRTLRKYGSFFFSNNEVATGICLAWTLRGTAGNVPFAAADGTRGIRYTTAGAAGDNAGRASASAMTCRNWKPYMFSRYRINEKDQTRLYIGYNNTGGSPAGDDPLNAAIGYYFGKISTNGNWVIMSNDGSGTTDILDTQIPADVGIHNVEIISDISNNQMVTILDGVNIFETTTGIPSTTQSLNPLFEIEAVDANARTLDIMFTDVET